jgi:hypothetical protein
MRKLSLLAAVVGLGLTLLPSLGVFLNLLTWRSHAQYMAVGMVLWFVGASLGFRRSTERKEEKE